MQENIFKYDQLFTLENEAKFNIFILAFLPMEKWVLQKITLSDFSCAHCQ